MSHLLSRLVDRALGTAPTIEPVRAPVFMDASPGFGDIAEHDTPGFVYGDLVTTLQTPLSQTADARDGLTEGVARQEEPGVVAATPAQPRVMDAVAMADKDVSSTATVKSQQQQGHKVVASSVDAQSVRTTSKIAEPAHRDTDLSPLNSATSQTIRDQPVSHDITRHLDATPPAVEQGNERAPGQVAVASQQPLRPRMSLPPQHGAVDKPLRESINLQAAPPTIQVTIGRIEVRAVTTPSHPAPRARKQPQPTLSLDDYLRQRKGGQR